MKRVSKQRGSRSERSEMVLLCSTKGILLSFWSNDDVNEKTLFVSTIEKWLGWQKTSGPKRLHCLQLTSYSYMLLALRGLLFWVLLFTLFRGRLGSVARLIFCSKVSHYGLTQRLLTNEVLILADSNTSGHIPPIRRFYDFSELVSGLVLA